MFTDETVDIPGRGLLHILPGGTGLPEPEAWVGQEIWLNGTLVRVTGVETFSVARPYPPGLPVGIFAALEWPGGPHPVLPVTGEIDTHVVWLDGAPG